MNAEKIKNDPDKSCWEDVTSQCITFPSEWRDRHPTHDAATQSAPIETSDEMQQTIRSAFITNGTCDSNIQCELDANSELFHRELIPDGQKLLHIYPSCGSEITQETLRSIVQALSTATPLLDSNLTTRAFKGYRARSTQQSECAVDPCHSLTPSFTLQQEHQYHILVMGWNCNFTMLAVSYGRNDVTTWCLERGHVCIYREFQTKPTAEAAPEWVEPLDLEQSTYVTSLSFHPTQPATMALGTFTGDLVILSLDRGEGAAQSLFSTKNMTTLPLRDAIVKIVWIPSQSGGSESMWLCTVCNDGQVFLWERSIKTNIIEVRHSMEFEPKIGMQIKVNTSAVGAVCVESIRNMNDLILIVGTDNGYTFQSHPNALSVQSLGIFNREKSEQPHSLSGATSQSHTGAVTDLSLAPQGGFLFATCGCDGRIRVCTTHDNICRVEMEPKAAAIEHYLTCIAWSPHRPSLVAVGTREGTLHVYDLSSSTQSPAVSVNCGHNTSLTTVHFHPTEKSLLITGDTRGKVTIWYLKGSFMEQTPLEKVLKNERRSTHLRKLWLELLGVHL